MLWRENQDIVCVMLSVCIEMVEKPIKTCILFQPITKQTLLQSLPRGFTAKARALYKYIFWSPVIGDFFGLLHLIARFDWLVVCIFILHKEKTLMN